MALETELPEEVLSNQRQTLTKINTFYKNDSEVLDKIFHYRLK